MSAAPREALEQKVKRPVLDAEEWSGRPLSPEERKRRAALLARNRMLNDPFRLR
ncbi:hypothetical protein ACFV6D_09845 [Kitasatospora sp. NPDC059812]|uniref:hypothetical protein n=1 Tax=Kitasatospora sp. NPDC059812 TaxID=3346958 RepID=UPI003657FE51